MRFLFVLFSIFLSFNLSVYGKALCGNTRCHGEVPSAKYIEGCNLARSLIISGWNLSDVINECEKTYGIRNLEEIKFNKYLIKLANMNSACKTIAPIYIKALKENVCQVSDFSR